MRSGVGAPDELAKHGIPDRGGAARRRTQPDRASVGQHLVLSRPRRRASPISNAITPRRRCGSPRASQAARPATCASRCWRARAGTRSASASARSISSSTRPTRKGRSRLRSADPADEPLVDFRMLSDRRDLERLRNAFRFVAEIATAPRARRRALEDLPDQLFGPRAARFRARACATRCRCACSPACSAALPPLRSWLIDTLVTERRHARRSARRRRDARRPSEQGGRRRVASGRQLPHGPRRRSARRDHAAGPRARRRGLARVRRLGDAVDPVREHQHLRPSWWRSGWRI